VAAQIRNELVTQLKSKGIEVVDGAKADAVLNVQVGQYGLTMADMRGRFPQLRLGINLTKPNGEMIWRHWAAADGIPGITKQVEVRPVADFFNDPALLRREIRKVTALVIASAVSTL
jgi:hypothetical protein